MSFVMIVILSLFLCLALSSVVPKECADATEAVIVGDMFSVVQSLLGARPAKWLSGSFVAGLMWIGRGATSAIRVWL